MLTHNDWIGSANAWNEASCNAITSSPLVGRPPWVVLGQTEEVAIDTLPGDISNAHRAGSEDGSPPRWNVEEVIAALPQ